eukprot:508983-Prymnesium_polylepis.1
MRVGALQVLYRALISIGRLPTEYAKRTPSTTHRQNKYSKSISKKATASESPSVPLRSKAVPFYRILGWTARLVGVWGERTPPADTAEWRLASRMTS